MIVYVLLDSVLIAGRAVWLLAGFDLIPLAEACAEYLLLLAWAFGDTMVGNISGSLVGSHPGTNMKCGNPQLRGMEDSG